METSHVRHIAARAILASESHTSVRRMKGTDPAKKKRSVK